MERIYIRELKNQIGKEVMIRARVFGLRKLGNVTFVLVQDRSGGIQTVWEGEVAAKVGDVVELTGQVVAEPRAKGGIEVHGTQLVVLATSIEDLPIDLSKPELSVQLTTLLDHRPLTLRHPKVQAIFRLYDILLREYERVMRAEDFTEVKTPKFMGSPSEGGANFFRVEYFDKHAYLAQSPQLYKQILVGVFERVFEIGPVFRAEPHFTTRHVNEYVSLDAEMGFIDSFRDVTATLTRVLKQMFGVLAEEGQPYLELYQATVPVVPDEIPHLKLAEVKAKIKERYHYEVPAGTDIDPEGERLAGRYAKEEFDSDFLFITHYPWTDRPFYTMPDPDNPAETLGFDLLLRGMEIVTGAQRIHDYQMLVDNMAKKNVSPAGMEFYVNTFKYAMPPHGGWGMGSERLIQQILGLASIKEAVLFPRDVKRLGP